MQPNKLILCVLTANVLSACSSPPKLSEPKGDWVSFESTTMQMSAAPSYINVGIQQVDNVTAKQQPGIITPVLQPYSDKTLLVLSNGKNEPLYKAVRSVVPASWGIKLSPEVAQKFRGKVSWTGNDQWPYVLQRMLASAGLTSTVNDSTKEVVIYFSAPAIKPASSVLTPGKKLMNEKVIRPDATPEKVNVLHIEVLQDNKPVRIRLANIDAPEKIQPFGTWSANQLKKLVAGKQVKVTYTQTDRYGRVLGLVETKYVNVNRAQIISGAAWVYDQYNADTALPALQKEAQEQRRGLWAESNPIPPWEWRHRKN